MSLEHGELAEIPDFEDAILQARGVETGYGDNQILFEADIDVRENEIVLLMGPNGAGKSTLIKAIYGLLPLWGGTIHINNLSVGDSTIEDLIHHGVNFVPQRDNVFPNLSVADNLELGGLSTQDTEERIEELYSLFPILEENKEQKAATLSGGEKQILALGRGLMTEPEVILIDEASAGLAPQLVDDVFEHIEYINETGTAILIVEQNVRAGLEIADRGYVLDQGKVRFEGSADQLKHADQIQDLYMGL